MAFIEVFILNQTENIHLMELLIDYHVILQYAAAISNVYPWLSYLTLDQYSNHALRAGWHYGAVHFTIRLFFMDRTPLTLLVISTALLTAF